MNNFGSHDRKQDHMQRIVIHAGFCAFPASREINSINCHLDLCCLDIYLGD